MINKLETTCPSCGSSVRFTLDDVAKRRTVRCSRGHSVKLQDDGGGAQKASKALRDLDKTLRKFGK